MNLYAHQIKITCLIIILMVNILKTNMVVDMTGISRTAQKEGSWDISPVELGTPLMIAGVVTPVGSAIGSVLQIVALVLVETPLVVVMESSMLSLTPEMMTLLTQSQELCAML